MNESPIRPPRSLALPFDPLLLVATLGIMACSLIAIGASTSDDIPGQPDYYLNRQALFFAVGLVIAAAISRIDYTRLRELKYGIYALSIGLILAVWAFGGVTRGSRRAIQLPFFEVQSSELVKVLLIVVLSAVVVDRARDLGSRQTTARIMLLALIPTALVMLQPDLGSALVYVVSAVAILFVAGVPWQRLAVLGAIGVSAIVFVLAIGPAVGVSVLHDYQVERLTAFLHPTDNPGDEGYQQNQSRIAVGAGQRTGRGELASQTRLNFLPEHHTDFIFAVVGERWGFTGSAIVLTLYALLLWRGLRILTISKNLYGALIAGGIVAMILFQLFVNVGMNIGIMPITGIPLPLMSYGGSSVLTTLIAIGLLQSIYAQGRAAAATKGRVLTM
ncbi:MAG: rod shape-determining protein RodA [Solirubrobacteraceae bacterium]|nr:rod shape-determining protein RodA [Solirubrobacteraceae bacterium]